MHRSSRTASGAKQEDKRLAQLGLWRLDTTAGVVQRVGAALASPFIRLRFTIFKVLGFARR